MADATLTSMPRRRLNWFRPLMVLLLLLAVFAAGAGVGQKGLLEPLLPLHMRRASPELASQTIYLPIQTIVQSVGSRTDRRQLRFTSQIEVAKADEAQLLQDMPRILDLLNVYFSELGLDEISDRQAIHKIKEQLLWKYQVVLGADKVKSILVTEFILN